MAAFSELLGCVYGLRRRRPRGTGVNRLVFVLWESFTGVVETVQNVLPTWSMPRGYIGAALAGC